jgi:Glycosyltransferase family 87
VQLFGWSGTWDDLPAAHAAAIVFDLLAVALLFLLGRRVRGPTLGIALAYAWVAYPFTLYALDNSTDDTLVAVLVLAALVASRSAPARGALAALAGLTKFVPLALAPLLATHRLWGDAGGGGSLGPGREHAIALWQRLRIRPLTLFLAAFALAGAVACIPAFSHDSLNTIYQRTLAFQSGRGSPFSVWGLYGKSAPSGPRSSGLGGLLLAVQIAAVVLALVLALIPRPRDLVALAAACAAVIIAVQLGLEHWFYLYIPWFAGLALLALLGSLPSPPARTALASEPA